MNGNAELLNFVYQNSQMGINTIEQLLEIAKDNTFKEHLKKQLEGYLDIHKTAKSMLNENGYDEKGVRSLEKLKTYLMINIQTLSNKTASHISEMMISGSTMGVTDALKNIHKYEDAEKDILKLMKQLKSFEESNIENLKKFV